MAEQITKGEHDPDYIGDGVYVSHDGYHVWLETLGGGPHHQIGLEPAVFNALIKYRERVGMPPK